MGVLALGRRSCCTESCGRSEHLRDGVIRRRLLQYDDVFQMMPRSLSCLLRLPAPSGPSARPCGCELLLLQQARSLSPSFRAPPSAQIDGPTL